MGHHSCHRTKFFTLTLGEDVSGRVLLPVRSAGGLAAVHLWVQLRDGADAQGQGLVDKRSLHVVHLKSRSWFSIEQQNLVPGFQTWWKTRGRIKRFYLWAMNS